MQSNPYQVPARLHTAHQNGLGYLTMTCYVNKYFTFSLVVNCLILISSNSITGCVLCMSHFKKACPCDLATSVSESIFKVLLIRQFPSLF